MYSVVDAVLTQYMEAIAKVDALSRVVTRFRGFLDIVKKHNRDHLSAIAGVTDAKNIAGEKLIEQTLRIGSALYLFGRDAGNEQLKAVCRFKRSALNSLGDSALQELGIKIADLAQGNAGAIAPMGISDDDITTYKTSLETFGKQLADHYQKHAESKAAREMLSTAFDKVNEILREELDVLVDMIRESDKTFYEEYQAARKIKDFGVHTSKTGKPEEALPETAAATAVA